MSLIYRFFNLILRVETNKCPAGHHADCCPYQQSPFCRPSIVQVKEFHLVHTTYSQIIPGRNQEYLDLAVNYTVSVFVRGSIIGLLPGFLKP